VDTSTRRESASWQEWNTGTANMIRRFLWLVSHDTSSSSRYGDLVVANCASDFVKSSTSDEQSRSGAAICSTQHIAGETLDNR